MCRSRRKNEAKSLLRKLLDSKAAASALGPGAHSFAAKYFAGEQRAGVKDSLAPFRVLGSHDKKRSIFRKIRPERTYRRGKFTESFGQEKQKDYVMRQLIPTLTQSGLLAVLLQRQRDKVIQLAQRRARRRNRRAALWNTLTWPYRALTAPTLVGDSAEPFVGTVPRPPLNFSPGQ